MSPCYSVGACKAERDLGAMVSGGGEDVRSSAGGVQLSRRHPESAQRGSNSALKVSRDSHRIRKPPLPLPPVQYRPPIIIHTYSPKVIHTQPDDFMSLVQKLTGSSDTRLRLKSKSPKPLDTPPPSAQSAATTSLERQGSGASSATVTNCGSPSSSEESATVLVADQSSRAAKQSNSPRSPLDSHFEFDTVSDALLNQFPGFADAAASGSAMFHHPQVKTEFSFHDASISNNPFATFFADFMHHHPKPVQPPRPSMHPHQSMSPFIAPPSPNLMPDLHWSQSTYLDHGGSQFVNQAPYLRQRASYSPSPDGTTMVALENIHAFMLT